MSVFIRNSFFSIFSAFFLLGSTAFAADSKTIQIKGSDTMVNLGQSWAEEFMAKHPDTSIAVTGGGSGTGISAITEGTCDIAQSSREVSAEEKAKAEAKGHAIKEIMVAYDGIAVVVNPNNPVNQLTLSQLADIFTGKIHNWKELGGKDEPILVLSRERNSGTHVFFLEHVLRHGNAKGPEEFSASALMMPSSQAIVEEVKNGESAIGYIGLGYVNDSLKVLEVAKDAQGPFLKPSVETVQSGEYSISRSLFFLTHGEPQGVVKDFVDFAESDAGQEIVLTLDFVPKKK